MGDLTALGSSPVLPGQSSPGAERVELGVVSGEGRTNWVGLGTGRIQVRCTSEVQGTFEGLAR